VSPAQVAAGSDEPPSGALYAKAVQIVIASQRASVSGVQRHLRIGFNLAAAMIERMETEGIVSAPQPDGVRRVLVEHL
jgi:S-DNA-T family DNA segregation ATPase FtsK/SpoIIIE